MTRAIVIKALQLGAFTVFQCNEGNKKSTWKIKI